MSEKNAQLYVDKEGFLHREDVEEPEESCTKCSKKPGMITAFAYENALMHKDMDNERSHKSIWIVCGTAIVLTLIFVLAYTLRMNAFIDTINKMTAALVELAGAKGIPAP